MKKLVGCSLAALLGLSTMAFAGPGGGGQGCCDASKGPHSKMSGPCPDMRMHAGKPGVGMILKAADEIKLTEDQKGKLQQMAVVFELEKVDRHASVKKAEIKLRALMKDEKADENNVMNAIDEVARLKADLHKMLYRRHREIRNLLTDEQLNKLKELRKERKKECRGMKEGPHHGMGMGFGMEPEPDD